MKNIIFTISLLLTVSIALAQEVNVPSEAAKTFESFINSNKDCENVVWTQKDNNFVAFYQKGKVNHTTTFNSEGNFIENFEEVSVNTLSENVLNYIDENFSKSKIVQCFFSNK
jgi:tRNA A37 threonylcarbamoyladenosine modification protein TsaB